MNLADITGRWIGSDYQDHGCLKFCYLFLQDLGRHPPKRVGDWGVDNYTELVAADIRGAQRVMLKSFIKIGRRASARYPALGDLLVVNQKNAVMFPAVYVGGGKAIASFIKKGVMVFRLDGANRVVLARRVA